VRTAKKALLPIAAAAAVVAMSSPSAHADEGSGPVYSAKLSPLNHATGAGMLTLSLNGNVATVTEHWSGLAATFGGAPYPHVQHIHVGGQGQCPTSSADKNGDGVVSTTEGAPAYGGLGATLSVKGATTPSAGTNIKIAPAGASIDYSRTITLTKDVVQSIKSGTAVIVVHGLDPATLSQQAQKEKSDLVPSLPLAATSPALCGVLTAMPGAPQTGSGSTAGTEDGGLLGLGGGLVAAGGAGLLLARRRFRSATDDEAN
jgi:hypothetical protein